MGECEACAELRVELDRRRRERIVEIQSEQMELGMSPYSAPKLSNPWHCGHDD